MNNNIELSREYELVTHHKGKAYPIEISDWNHIKQEIENIPICESKYLSISLFLFGVTITSIFTLFASTFGNNLYLIITWIILLTSAIIGVVLLIINSTLKNNEKSKADSIIQFLDQLESKFDC